MKNNAKTISRRAVLDMGVRSLAGVGVLSYLQPLSAAVDAGTPSGSRALVCIYLFGGEGGAHLVEHSPSVAGGLTPHPAATELRALQETGALTVWANEISSGRTDQTNLQPDEIMAKRYAGLRFLPNGFVTPEWAARLAGIQEFSGKGALTFRSGVSLVSPGAVPRSGDAFENAGIRQAMNNVSDVGSFPDTVLGRQLQDVVRLLKVGGSLGLNSPIFCCTASGFTAWEARAGLLAKRYRELSQALASFHAATVELGLNQRVTTYTDAEIWPLENRRRLTQVPRLAFGGAAFEADPFRSGLTADASHAKLAAWLGFYSGDIRRALPGFSATQVRT